jgi:hypothetical protein
MSLMSIVATLVAGVSAVWFVLATISLRRWQTLYRWVTNDHLIQEPADDREAQLALYSPEERKVAMVQCRSRAVWYREQLEAVDHCWCELAGEDPEVHSEAREAIYRRVWGHSPQQRVSSPSQGG